jgi:hypothetical protein
MLALGALFFSLFFFSPLAPEPGNQLLASLPTFATAARRATSDRGGALSFEPPPQRAPMAPTSRRGARAFQLVTLLPAALVLVGPFYLLMNNSNGQ